MRVRERLVEVAMRKGLRQSILVSYETLLNRLGILDLDEADVTRDGVLEALWTIDDPNSRRATVITVRSVLGFQIKIPKGVPRRYDLPNEDGGGLVTRARLANAEPGVHHQESSDLVRTGH